MLYWHSLCSVCAADRGRFPLLFWGIEYRAQMVVVIQQYCGSEFEDPTLIGDLKKRVRLCELFYIVAVSG